MKDTSDAEILSSAREMLVGNGMLSHAEGESLLMGSQCLKIDSDGSTRRFWRVGRKEKPFCIIAAPGGTDKEELAESRAAWKIGRHLRSKGVPVPEIVLYDRFSGVVFLEDLGDTHLQDLALAADHPQAIIDNYEQTNLFAKKLYISLTAHALGGEDVARWRRADG